MSQMPELDTKGILLGKANGEDVYAVGHQAHLIQGLVGHQARVIDEQAEKIATLENIITAIEQPTAKEEPLIILPG